MSIVGGLDIHRKQLTFDWVDEQNGKWERGRIVPADREHLADWLTRFDGVGPVGFAMEGCAGISLPPASMLETEYLHAVTEAEVRWLDIVITRLADGTLTWSAREMHRPSTRYGSIVHDPTLDQDLRAWAIPKPAK